MVIDPSTSELAQSTAKLYAKIANRLVNLFKASHVNHPASTDAILASTTFRTWLTTTFAPTIVRTSWRLYRAALVHYSALTDPKLPDLYSQLNIQASPRRPTARKRKVRTSSQRQRSLDPEQLALLIDALALRRVTATRPEPYAVAIALLALGPHTGLRPVEWRGARLDSKDGRPTLVVQNAKHTHGRSHGPTRTLYIDRLPEWIQRGISDLIDLASPLGINQWIKLYSTAQHRVRLVTRQLFPEAIRWPTIYSGRHQAVLNMRDARYSVEEIAAAMGHINPKTATRNYGRRTKTVNGAGATVSAIIRPTADDIGRVKTYTDVPQAGSLSDAAARLLAHIPANIKR
jgi:hypothetical protein